MDLFIGALFLSIWHSILFWNKEIGLSAILFAIPVIYMTIKILKNKVQNKKALLLSIPVIILSSTYFIFDNSLFKVLNLFIMPLIYIIMMILATNQEIKLKGNIRKIFSIIFSPFNYFGEVVELIKSIRQKGTEKEERTYKQSNTKNIVKAIILTFIIALVIVLLLSSADKEFAKLFGNILDKILEVSIPSILIRICLMIFIFFYICSFFISMISKCSETNKENIREEKEKDPLTIYMILTVLNIIYLIFCYIQVKSLFTIENIKFSSYARQGFFQLMIVSLINILTILKATNKDLKETEKNVKYKKTMCIIMLVFTLIIIISSFVRMSLYQQNYGDTRLRILVNFSLITEIILLVPTAIYIINSKINLTKSYLIILITMYCIINLANIDYIIAKNNIDRYIETGKIDLNYLINNLRGADTINQMIRLQETNFKYSDVNDKDNNYIDKEKYVYNLQQRLNTYLSNLSQELKVTNRSFQEFNLSRWIAQNKLEDIKYN